MRGCPDAPPPGSRRVLDRGPPTTRRGGLPWGSSPPSLSVRRPPWPRRAARRPCQRHDARGADPRCLDASTPARSGSGSLLSPIRRKAEPGGPPVPPRSSIGGGRRRGAAGRRARSPVPGCIDLRRKAEVRWRPRPPVSVGSSATPARPAARERGHALQDAPAAEGRASTMTERRRARSTRRAWDRRALPPYGRRGPRGSVTRRLRSPASG